MQIIAWTGGTRPAAISEISPNERAIVRAIFRDSMREVYNYWRDYRGLNDSTLDMARIQWKRARYCTGLTMPYIIIKRDDFGGPLLREWRPDTYHELFERLGEALF